MSGPSCEGDDVDSVDLIIGGAGNDVLVGTAGHQEFEGLGGQNTLRGGADRHIPGLLQRRRREVHGGSGRDTMTYAESSTSSGVDVTLDDVANDGQPGEGDNIGSDVEILIGSILDDHLTGRPGPDRITGLAGDDVLSGLGGKDTLNGGPEFQGNDGSDVFHGGTGIDTVVEDGHQGDLVLSIDDQANDRVVGDPSQGVDDIRSDVENVVGGLGNDTITGARARTGWRGGPGNDILLGVGGDDLLIPGPGTDSLRGGPDTDTASYSSSTSAITANLSTGAVRGEGPDQLSQVENLLGSPSPDHLTGSERCQPPHRRRRQRHARRAGRARQVLLGGGGNDHLDGGPDTDTCKQGGGTGPIHCEH